MQEQASAQSGWIPGLEGVVAVRTDISLVEDTKLTYRGYSIDDILKAKAEYEADWMDEPEKAKKSVPILDDRNAVARWREREDARRAKWRSKWRPRS